jgi:hypothetical protein
MIIVFLVSLVSFRSNYWFFFSGRVFKVPSAGGVEDFEAMR